MNKRFLLGTLLLIVTFMLGSACTTISTIKSHPLVLKNNADDAATVYFLRPEPLRTRGIADNDIHVELDDKLAVLLSAGEYVALKVKPGKVNVTLRNHTYLTSKPMPEEVFRSAEFDFKPRQSYLIHAKFTQEEFRGIYFTPREIDLAEAKQFGSRLAPHGKLAKSVPIDSL